MKVLCVEKDNIEKGIVDFISEHGIEKLVMGAAASKYYSSVPRLLQFSCYTFYSFSFSLIYC